MTISLRVLTIGCALLLAACGGGIELFDSGVVTVAGPGSWGGEGGVAGNVLVVANDTNQAVRVVEVRLQSGDVGVTDAFEVTDSGTTVDGQPAVALPPGPLRPLPIAVASGDKVEVVVWIQLRSCDALGDWEVDPDTEKVTFRTTQLSPYELVFDDGGVLVTNVYPPINNLQPVDPGLCGV